MQTRQTPAGVWNQIARGQSSFAAATARHTWEVPDQYNITGDVVDGWADQEEHAHRTALGVLDDDGMLTRTSWAELQQLTRKFGSALLGPLEIRRGDVVAVVLGQSLAAAVAHLGAYRVGAVVCPISHLYAGEALAWRLAHSETRVLVTEAAGYEQVAPLVARLPHLRHVVVVGAWPATDVHEFWQLLESSAPNCETVATLADEPAILIYTSGTTGHPKGVLHAHRVALGHANVSYLLEGVGETDAFWSPNDWSWIAGLGNGLLAQLGLGVTVLSMGSRRFDPIAAAEFVDTYRPSVGYLPPSALRLMRQHRITLQHPLRCLVTGGEVLSDDLRDWTRDHLCRSLNNGFGQTEGNDTLGVVHAWEQPAAETIGRVLPGHEAAVLDPDGHPLPDGEQGELCLREQGSPVFFLQYLKNPDETARTKRGGWIHTGDQVTRDSDGYFHFVGRGDDVIKSSGYRIGPTEIENTISRHPAVLECVVVGLPDPVRGQVVTAVLRLAPGADEHAVTEELTALTRDQVGRHAYPRRFEFVSEFPKTVTGKIQRAVVRTQFV